jgi:hypothetical protein
METRGQDFATMREQLNELLLREASTGQRFVLVIDEAQRGLREPILPNAFVLARIICVPAGTDATKWGRKSCSRSVEKRSHRCEMLA